MINPIVTKGKFVRFSGEYIIKYDSRNLQDIKIIPIDGRYSNADGKPVSSLKIVSEEFYVSL